MSKELVISATPHETRVAIVEDGQLCEIYIEREKEFALVGSLYKGRVTRVLPGMQSAFVDIGLDSDAFLYVSDFLEHLEEYDHVAAPAEKPPFKAAHPTGEVFGPSTTNGGPSGTSSSSGDAGAAGSSEPVVSRGLDTSGFNSEPDAQDELPTVASESPTADGQHAPTQDPRATSAPVSAIPQPQKPFEQRPDRGRGGPRGQGDRGDRGGRGGRNQRGSRPSGGRGGRPGRDLPPSKYASSRPTDAAPRDAHAYEPPPGDYKPITLLPGESLAKYKDRPPVSAAVPSSEPPSGNPTTQTRTDSHTSPGTEQRAGLPSSLYAAPRETFDSRLETKPEEHTHPHTTAHEHGHEHERHEEGRGPVPGPGELVDFPQDTLIERAASVVDIPQLAAPPRVQGPPYAPTGSENIAGEQSKNLAPDTLVLSEDDLSSLTEQLAEAKHEEAQAQAQGLPTAAESVVESSIQEAEVEESEMDDLEDAMHDDHEDAVAEHEAAAEESHDAALAGEASTGSEEHEESHHPDETQPVDPQNAETHDASGSAPSAPPMAARISDQSRARFQRPMRRGGNRQRPGQRSNRPNERRPYQQPSHGHPRHEQQKRPQLISEMLKAGQEIIVQIAKEPLGKKGARITSHVALPGRFLVYMPTVDHIGVSRRIGSAEDRSRLRRVVTEAKGTFPGGFIVRTAAGGASDDEIRADVEFLGRTWDTIRGSSEQRHAPSLLHRDLNLVERILRDYLSEEYVAIWLDNEEEFSKVVEFVGRFQPKMVGRVKLYTKESPIFEEFGIQQDLDKALRPKVWLKSGGYIVINHTEALVAIDVNTGKFVGRGSTRLEDTIVKTNLEAVKEIVRQIRLRDLGGIIVMDLIDMEERRNRDKVMAALDQALAQDRAPSKALSFNEFGLVCVTRKRTKQALERVLCQPCPYCTGSGMVKSIPTICYEIQVEARKMSADLDAQSLTLRVNPEIAKSLKTRESSLIEELEQSTRKSVIIQSDPTLHWEQYDIY